MAGALTLVSVGEERPAYSQAGSGDEFCLNKLFI